MKPARSESTAYRPARRLRALRVVVPLALLCGIALSPRLWLTDAREYPLVPVAEGLPRLGAPLDAVALAALAAGLAAIAVTRRSRAPVAVALVLVIALAALDENRWQPWAYQYTLGSPPSCSRPGVERGCPTSVRRCARSARAA